MAGEADERGLKIPRVKQQQLFLFLGIWGAESLGGHTMFTCLPHDYSALFGSCSVITTERPALCFSEMVPVPQNTETWPPCSKTGD